MPTSAPASQATPVRVPTATQAPPPGLAAPQDFRRRVKNLGKRGLRKFFEAGQYLGFDILPRHFYSEIPDLRELRRDDSWKLPRTMFGVAGAEPADQFDFVEACARSADLPPLLHADACRANGEVGYGAPDAEFLYAFIRANRPGKVVQIGCGVSTAVIQRAAEAAGYRPEIVCIEPYPTPFLRREAEAGRIQLLQERAQDVPIAELTDLGDDGFLFIDSTHTVKPGSEVNRLVLEVLPRLAPGTWVHFHDIYFPFDYQRGLMDDELFFSNESVLLHAFLLNNRACTIRASLSMLHHADPARLGQSLPSYRAGVDDHGLRVVAGAFPASIYLQAVAEG